MSAPEQSGPERRVAPVAIPYSGYSRRGVKPEDAEITHVLPDTPLGEYLRRFWQPVCMSSQLKDVTVRIRAMGEDLVAFRDLSGRVGVLHQHCAHRGASLEFAVIQQRGIRCCYHGFHYDVDGCLLEAPAEPDKGVKLKQTICQGAYPAFEKHGLVFAYLGPPDKRPPFEDWDAFDTYSDIELVPFSNVFACNWLQIIDNISDQMHTSVLHQPGTLFPGPVPPHLDVAPFTLPSFGAVPVIDYFPVRDATAMAFVAGRRTSDSLVWWRINECALPNMSHHAYLFEDGKTRRLFHRVHMVRWYVPVDNTHTIVFGWRMFGFDIDPMQKGRRDRVGWDDMDFLEGQVNNRTYEERQRIPGDYEAIVGQRPIAIHALENPTSGDIGVYMFRKIVRDAIRGSNPAADPLRFHEPLNGGGLLHTFTQNTILQVPRQTEESSDRALIKRIGKQLIQITDEANNLEGDERSHFIRSHFEEIERGCTGL